MLMIFLYLLKTRNTYHYFWITWILNILNSFFILKTTTVFLCVGVKITRPVNGFIKSLFLKATFSGIFNNFDSFIFRTYKIEVIFALLFQYFTIVSDMRTSRAEMEQLRIVGRCNGYPISFFHQGVTSTLFLILIKALTFFQ